MNLDPYLEATFAQEYPTATLYVVATPIGNLGDITLRALALLSQVDRVVAEDTRVAKRLLSHFGLDKPCVAGHRHNERSAAQFVVEALQRGERIAYLSDAGTPGIADPGARLVESVRAAGFRVLPLPGASAMACALSASGFSEGGFYFAGFLPARPVQAERVIKSVAELSAQLIFYEAPHRVLDTVALLAKTLDGGRTIVIARELTKVFEAIVSMPLSEALEWLGADPNRQRGEFVLIVEAPHAATDPVLRARPTLLRLLAALPLSEAVALTSELTGASRKDLYASALSLKPPG